jgi:hypothetical protein
VTTRGSAPRILDLPAQRMAAVHTVGDPNVVGPDAIGPLSNAAFMVKFAGATIERWQYGTVAEIVHRGPYAGEPAAIARLLACIAEQGYQPIGEHEEL